MIMLPFILFTVGARTELRFQTVDGTTPSYFVNI